MKIIYSILSMDRPIVCRTASATLLTVALTFGTRAADLKLPIAAGPF